MLLTKRTRRCKVCRTDFHCRSMTHKVCSLECALSLAQSDRAKAERKATMQARKAAKTRPDYIREAQVAFNAYIRTRDAGQPCISCGTPLINEGHGGGFDAGHYRSRGAAPQHRFNPLNVFGQCKKCNRYLGGNVAAMRVGMVARIGVEAVEFLESANAESKLTIDDLIDIRREYIAKRKALEAAQ